MPDHRHNTGRSKLFNFWRAPPALRTETYRRVEAVTQRPLIVYANQVIHVPQGLPAYVEDGDLTGFQDLILTTPGESVDVLIVSNGGSAEVAERIIRILRETHRDIRFLVPSNAYSAATLMCFAGNEIVIDRRGTLGPIDPQINGIPARAILRAFEQLEERLKKEGPRALTAYMPLLSKYDLHILEICRSAEELSKELARHWLAQYMLDCEPTDPRVERIVAHFSDYDLHKSHGRSIAREKAQELGLRISWLENMGELCNLCRSLTNQLEFFFDKTAFYKLFENNRGIHWGRQQREVSIQLPLVPAIPQPPQPGPPGQSTN